MTKQEVISFIRKDMVKPYISLGMPQSTFSYTLNRVESGLATPEVEREFFRRLGFTVDQQATYKISEFPPVKFRS